MKHVAALLIALISLTFFIGADCDSGDFQTSYFYCCDLADTTCSTDPTKCPAGGCSTGQQVFTNGQNECATIQLDAPNNNCALIERVDWYVTIGCSGVFAENPEMSAPTNVQAVAQGIATIVVTWTPPVSSTGSLTFNVMRGTVSGGEGLLLSGVVGNQFVDTAPSVQSGQIYYYTVSATNIAGTSATSAPEAVATAN